MRVEVSPSHLSVVPGKPRVVTVQVTNTASVISGHRLRVLGLDPSWVRVDQDQLSLFPDTTGAFVVTFDLPAGLPAGTRRLEIEVSELTPPNEVSLSHLELTVPAEPDLAVSLDPVSLTGGRRASAGVLVANTGNATLDVRLEGKDEEGHVAFAFTPPDPSLGPGEQVLGTVQLTAKRPWFGSPKMRPFSVRTGPAEAPAQAFGVWVQRPRFTRGNLALFGLLVAATVFAIVLSATLSQVVGQSNANRDLALQVAAAAQSHPTGGTASLAGTVTELGSGTPVSGVTVDIYPSSKPTQPLVSTATNASGGYHFAGLAAGTYKLSFAGAGFVELWYPESLNAKGAGVVTLKTKQSLSGIDIHLGGQPGSISGQVTGTSPTGAVLTLELAGGAGPASPGSAGSSGGAPATTAPGAASPGAIPAIVTTQTLSASGKFTLAKVPSPAVYDIVVSLPGYAPATQEVDLGGGEQRSGVTIELHKGDGSIAGTVSSPTGPIGGATISASSGSTTLTTITATTKGKRGTFSLANLPTPSSLTLVVSAPGYASQTLSVSLAPAQQVSGIAVTLLPGVGSISGTVTTPKNTATGGVTVTASNGSLTVSTTTLSTGSVGSYTLTGLPVPGTYTVTFSRPDLASQTQAVDLPASGPTKATGVDVTLVADTASLAGIVSDQSGQGVAGVAISLVSGSTTYTVTSASAPTPGAYAVGGITPGTYDLSFSRQGGVPTSVIVHLAAGQQLQQNETLTPAASIVGYVEVASTGQPAQSAQVVLYQSSQYPTVVTATTSTDASGKFSFPDVVAPQSYVVAVSFPKGSSPQATVLVTTARGAATPVCGSRATGTLPGSGPAPLTGTATTTQPVTTTTTAPSSSASCNAAGDPVKVRLP